MFYGFLPLCLPEFRLQRNKFCFVSLNTRRWPRKTHFFVLLHQKNAGETRVPHPRLCFPMQKNVVPRGPEPAFAGQTHVLILGSPTTGRFPPFVSRALPAGPLSATFLSGTGRRGSGCRALILGCCASHDVRGVRGVRTGEGTIYSDTGRAGAGGYGYAGSVTRGGTGSSGPPPSLPTVAAAARPAAQDEDDGTADPQTSTGRSFPNAPTVHATRPSFFWILVLS